MFKKIFFIIFCFLIFNQSNILLADVTIVEEPDLKIESGDVGQSLDDIDNWLQDNNMPIEKPKSPAVAVSSPSIDSVFAIEQSKIAAKPYYDRYSTIMFQDSSINGILQVLNNTYVSTSAQKSSTTAAVRPRSIEIVSENNLNIYLNSIMFVSVNDWTLWLNGQKITNINNGESEIRVVELAPKRAIFEWSMGLSKWGIVNANDNIPATSYQIHDDRVVMRFGLSPNQTFIPALNETIEGKVRIEAPAETAVESPKVEEIVIDQGENNFYF